MVKQKITQPLGGTNVLKIQILVTIKLQEIGTGHLGLVNIIKQRVETKVCEQSCPEVSKVTSAVVKLAAVSMKKCKGDVTGSYTSDAIRNAPDLLFDRLATVFQSWLYQEL